MFHRCFLVSLILLTLTVAANAAPLYPLPDKQLTSAAEKIRLKHYRDAHDEAVKAPPGGIREFVLGYTSFRLEQWDEAARHFDLAGQSFPLLADYALYNEARALVKLSRHNESLPILRKLIGDFHDSPLFRSALLLYAETLFDSDDYRNAFSAYQKFIEKYPSGTDSLTATYKSALCMEKLGNGTAAAASLRNIWLKSPASPLAAKAQTELHQLASSGVPVSAFGAEELLHRATTLYDLKKYDEAAAALKSVPDEAQPAGTADRFQFKVCQSLYRARRYKDAEAALSELLKKKTDRETADEALYWLAKTLDKTGREEAAFSAFVRLAESAASTEVSDNAMFQAALIRRGEKRGEESLALLKKLLLVHPASHLKLTVTWEIAWESYQAGDYKTAAEYFKPLLDVEDFREKALYWYGRALAFSGDIPAAREIYSRLITEFPFGFYSQTYRKEVKLGAEEIRMPARDMCEILPLPAGNERIKAFITLGMYEEARSELTAIKRKKGVKNGTVPGLARLYLEMGDYNGAYNLLRNERPVQFEKENLYKWGLCFPLAFREQVSRLAEDGKIPASLVYAVIRAESSYSPTALSPVGAVGLMQLMPSTAAALTNSSDEPFSSSSLTSPETNIRLGISHLRNLLTLYKGDLVLAVAAYNAGAGNVNRWRKSFGEARTDEFIENIPYAETREYVKKVLSSIEIYNMLYRLDAPEDVPTQQKGSDSPESSRPSSSKSAC
jgi:peptidoglycan lytic transglycosylase